MRELAVQVANENTSSNREFIQEKINQLTKEITRIGGQTQFNTMKLLDGSKISFTIQIGVNTGQTMTIETSDMYATELGITDIAVTMQSGTSIAIDLFDNAIQAESRIRNADMSKEITEQTKQSILAQIAMVMMFYTNHSQQSNLQLLK